MGHVVHLHGWGGVPAMGKVYRDNQDAMSASIRMRLRNFGMIVAISGFCNA
jgi:hypothetical protein